jgi:HEAT repeat protein
MKPRLLLLVVLLTGASAHAADEALYAGKPLSFWLAELKSSDPLIREEAIEVLTDAGTAAKSAVPQLEALLKDEQRSVRIRAGMALWKIAGQTKPAVAALTESLRDANAAARAQALRSLAQIGAAAVSSTPAILELVDETDALVRNQAIQTLQNFGPAAVPALTTALENKKARLRRNAGDVLSRMGGNARAAQAAFLRRLDDDDKRVRTACARALWGQGQATEAVAALLLDAARTGNSVEQQDILNVVGFGQRTKASVPILKELLKSGDLSLRMRAAGALWDIDPQPKLVLPIFIEGAKDPNFNVRSPAVQGIIRMGPAAREAVPALIEVLKSPSGSYDGNIHQALARIGAPSVPPLVEMLTATKPDPRLRTAATNILGQMGAVALPAVLPLLDHQDKQTRAAGCQIVVTLGPVAKDAVPKLTALLKDADFAVRQASITALGRIGPAAKSAAPALVELAKDKNVVIRTGSMRSLEQIKADPKLVRPLALAALEDENALVRCRALSLLWSVAPKHPDIMPHVLDLLKQPASRFELLDLVGRMGPAAARAVPALTDFVKDRDPNLRRQAIQALGRIGPAAKDAVPTMLEHLRPNDFFTRQTILTALISIRSDDGARIVPAVLEVAKQDQSNNRMLCLIVFTNLGSKASAAVPWLVEEVHRPPNYLTVQLVETLTKIDPERGRKEGTPVLQAMAKTVSPFRVQAAMALGRLKPDSEEALAALIDCLSDANAGVRQQASQFLGTLKPPARKAAPALKRLLSDPILAVRVNAAGSLWRINGDTEATIPVLLEALKPAPGNYSRYQAAAELGQMGPAAKSALPALLELRNDPDTFLRNGVLAAINRIDPMALKTKQP